MTIQILQGDCRDVMRTLAENSVDAIVTDPPYGLEFMGRDWDAPWKQTSGGFSAPGIGEREHAWPSYQGSNLNRCETCRKLIGQGGSPCKCVTPKPKRQDAERMALFQAWCEEWAIEALRVLKPGGYLLAFSGTRTYHRMVCAIEDAGFEVRDQIGWAYGSGFPKSHNGPWGGTALKPAWEPICVARKPLAGTVEANWREHGTGALNIDACRVSGEEMPPNTGRGALLRRSIDDVREPRPPAQPHELGRWPANLIHDGSDEVLAAFPDAPGQLAPVKFDAAERKTGTVYGAMKRGHEPSANSDNEGAVGFKMKPGARRLDAGSAARFFYCAKASKTDRGEDNTHPTVKPTELMRYLCRLVTPPGGLVLDPFLGSGSTLKAAELEGFSAIGIELSPDYIEIARRRIASDAPLFSQAAEVPSPA